MRRLFAIILTAVLFASCTMPETRIYNLSLPDEKEKNNNTSARASVNITVHSPRYLSQPYIALRTSPYQLEISKYSKWDAPPTDLVRAAFKDSFSSTGMFKEIRASSFPEEGFYSLEVNLKKFEKSDSSDASFMELVFEVTFRSPDGLELYSRSFSKTSKLDDKSFPGLAKGLSSALAEGITEVKTGVLKAMNTGG
jgi:ABC-type uncharacterized transport system auxiliary subunit